MDARNRETRDRTADPQDRVDLARWKLLIDELPDLRWEKVNAMRDALHRQDLDDADAVEGTLERLSDEFMILSRRSAP